ncbi:MAG: hypothetical protein C5B51_05885 [Terriglobia bacterium]|nr:MAG: hypothetical protein C5B51_05885 [Terriglobia bacterium]
MAKHPDLEALLQYLDGDLPAQQNEAVAAHLHVCSQCRMDEQRLRDARAETKIGRREASTFRENLRKWEAARLQLDAHGDVLKLRVVSELAPYVGAAAAKRILRAVEDSGENLLSTIEPVLGLFLGKSAAASLVNRIIDRVIMRT